MDLDGLLGRGARRGMAIALALIIVWCIGALAHLVLTTTMIRMGVRMWSAIYIQAGIAGTIATMLAGVVLAAALHRHRLVRKQLMLVAELNHQVRNALEIIASSTSRIADKQTVISILEGVMRIDDTLRHLFPAVGSQRR